MELEKIEIVANAKQIDPSFAISVKLKRQDEYKLLIRSSGTISANDKIISNLQPIDLTDYNEDIKDPSCYKIKSSWTTFFHAPLTKLALEKIENERIKNPKGDVILTLNICLNFIEPTFAFANGSFDDKTNHSFLYSDDRSIFRHTTIAFRDHIHKISASDWLHDYCPVLGLGKYQLFEFPELKIPTPKDKEQEELIDRIKGANDAFPLMESAMKDGDWTLVVKESRPVWELARSKDKISEILKTEGLSEQAITSFEELIKSLFDFAGNFLHKVDKTKRIVANTAEKEDAVLIHSMSLSIVNLLSQKIIKLS